MALVLSNASTIYDISNFTIGSTPISFTIQKYAATNDNLTVKIGNTVIATRNKITNDDEVTSLTRSITFSTAELTKIYNAMPKVTKATFTFTIESFIDGESIGSTSTTATGTLPSTIVPNLTAISLVESISGIATKFGGYVKNKSKINYSYSVTPATGTTISSYSLTIDSITYTKSSGNTNTLKNSGTINYSAYVIDSRGRKSNTKSGSITVLDYTAPQISTFKVVRCDASGNEINEGLYAKYTVNASISPVNNKNDKSFVIEYKPDGASWTTWKTYNTGYSLAETSGVKQIGEESCQFRITVKDYFNQDDPVIKTYALSSTFVLFELTEALDGIAWGKTAEESGVFDIGFKKTYISDNAYMGGDSRNDNEKNIYFRSTENGQYKHNTKVYGGNGTSPVAMGMWDAAASLPIYQYFDGDDYRLKFGEGIKLRWGDYDIEAILAKTFGTATGRIHYKNGLLIQWGTVTITPVANTPTSSPITFPIAFDSSPSIHVSALSTVAGTSVLGIGHSSDTATGTDLYVTRTNTTGTVVRWLAVGFKEVA